MKGNRINVVMMAIIWFWWTATCSTDGSTVPLGYNTVKFTTSGATRDSYSQFMVELRGQLATGYESHTIPVMRDPTTIGDSERYVLVELSNEGGGQGQTITLAIDVENAYVVGYQAGENSYFFDDAPVSARPNIFQAATSHNDLPFSGNYNGLETAAGGTGRENIQVGMPELDRAISALYHTNPIESSHSRRTVARSLTVVIQMVSEAARFKYIEQQVRLHYGGGAFQSFIPDNTMLSLETNWGALSSQIQRSTGGVFSRPVLLQPRYQDPENPGRTFQVDRVTTSIITNLALLLFICNPAGGKPASDNHHQIFSPFLFLRSNDDDDDTCSDVPEPTVRISGRYGKCVDVKGGLYHNGNPIVLWPCKSKEEDVNQLWTLKKDKTIRSKGKCLAAYGFNQGAYIMIYDCNSAEKNSIIWEIEAADGTISNPHSKLVLSATSGNDGTTLTVQKNKYVPYQAWSPVVSNETQYFTMTTTIFGYQDRCLQRNGPNTAYLMACSGGHEQDWYFYPDGTIRPRLDTDTCLGCEDDNKGSKVVMLACNMASSRIRWGVKSEGIFYNLVTRLVMDAKASDPNLQEIIMWTETGNPNQKWVPSLF